jgi:hypothetical protein
MQSDGNIWGLDAFVDLLVNDARNIDRFGLDYIVERIKFLNSKDSLDDDLSLLRIEFH